MFRRMTSRPEAMGPSLPNAARAGGKQVAKTADFKRAMAQASGGNAAGGAGTGPSLATPASTAGAGLLLQASLGSAPRAALPSARAPAATPDALRVRLASAERSDGHPNQGYGLRNPASGALGRYQLTPVALRDIGWQDAEGRWTAKAAAKGVTSEEGFLASIPAQEAAMGDYLNRTEQLLAAQGSLARAGQSLTGSDGASVPVTRAGLLAAAHRRGAGAVNAWLEHRLNRPEAPLSAAQKQVFASIETRMRDFADLEGTSTGRAMA